MLFHVDRNREAPVRLTISRGKTRLLSAVCLESCEQVSTGHAEEHDRSDQSREPVRLPCLMASVPFRPRRRVSGETTVKPKHTTGTRAWGIAPIKQQLPLFFFQCSILPQLFLSAKSFGVTLLHAGSRGTLAQTSPKPWGTSAHEQRGRYSLCPAPLHRGNPQLPPSFNLQQVRLGRLRQL